MLMAGIGPQQNFHPIFCFLEDFSMSLTFWTFLVFIVHWGFSLNPEKGTVDNKNEKEEVKFLIKYGYTSIEGRPPAIQEISAALKKAQKFGNIRVTGRYDEATKKLFKSKRCGVYDDVRLARKSQIWGKRRLTYSLENNSRSLSRNRVLRDLKKAFDIWSRYSGLGFSETNTNGDIKAAFYVRNHGDGNSFDGPGGTLAHAFSPGSGLGGDVHFDDDELWSDDLSFASVALHELGHSLGLQHLPYKNSVMNPYYKKELKLSLEDIRNIQALYHKN